MLMPSASTWRGKPKGAIWHPHLFFLSLLTLSGFLISILSAAAKTRMQIHPARSAGTLRPPALPRLCRPQEQAVPAPSPPSGLTSHVH